MSGKGPAPKLRCHLLFAAFAVILLTLGALPTWAVEPYSIEPSPVKPPSTLPAKILEALDPNGTRVFTYQNGLKVPVSEIFWVKSISPKATATKNFSYSDLSTGTLLGVIHFLPEALDDYREDFHDQKLKPGFYTLRYGNSKDADAHDFVFLSPIGADRDPGVTPSSDQLSQHGKLASRTSQAAIMALVPPESSAEDLPAARTDDEGTCILQTQLDVKLKQGKTAEKFNLAIILVPPIKDDGGS